LFLSRLLFIQISLVPKNAEFLVKSFDGCMDASDSMDEGFVCLGCGKCY
jgi:hypothetical protein